MQKSSKTANTAQFQEGPKLKIVDDKGNEVEIAIEQFLNHVAFLANPFAFLAALLNAAGGGGKDVGGVRGDPHATNIAGEKFDILDTGYKTLARFPKMMPEGAASFVVKADIRRVGKHCAQTFIRHLNVTGAWLSQDLSFRAGDVKPWRTTSIETFVNDQWVLADKKIHLPAVNFKPTGKKVEIDVKGEHAGKFYDVDVSVWALKHHSWNFLNVAIRGLKQFHGDIGGLLGVEDHEQVKNEEECTKTMDPNLPERLFTVGGF